MLQINFLWNCSHVNATEHIWWYVNIGSGNGAVSQQAIIWANVDKDLCHHIESLDHDEFMFM